MFEARTSPNQTFQFVYSTATLSTRTCYLLEGGQIPPILVLGEKSVGKQQRIAELEEQRSAAISKLEIALCKQQSACKDFDRFCIDRAKSIKDMLRSSSDNPYNKRNFGDDASQMVEVCGPVRRLRKERAGYAARPTQRKAEAEGR